MHSRGPPGNDFRQSDNFRSDNFRQGSTSVNEGTFRQEAPFANQGYRQGLISQKVFVLKSQFPYNSVNLSFIITHVENELTVLLGG